jgi:hypothetical protein
LLLRQAERQRGVGRRLGHARRDQRCIRHEVIEIVAARVLAIACGHEDAIDHDRLRQDPLLKMAVGRAPKTGAPLAMQSTISRFENATTKREAVRLTSALVDQFATSVKPGAQEILDIDDAVDAVHGCQQMSFFNARRDERCFLPIHVFHTSSGAPVVAILRTRKTPKGCEVATVLKHTTRRLRRHEHWHGTRIV